MTRTNAYSLLCVIIRVFALWVFVDIALQLPGTFLSANGRGTQEQFLMIGLVGDAFLFILASVLWLFADKVAKLALARPQQIVFESDIPVDEWQILAFSVVGLWQCIYGVIYSAERIVQFVHAHFATMTATPHSDLPEDFFIWMLVEFLRTFIGLYLLFGARGLTGLIRRYRQIGFHSVDAREPSESSAEDSAESGQPPRS